MARKRPLTYNGENSVSTFSMLFLIRSFSNLQVTRMGTKSRTCLDFGQIGSFPTELGAFERLKKFPIGLTIGKWCTQASSFILYRIFVKLAGNQDRHKISNEFEFRPDRISHFRVTFPWRRIQFSIDLLWNLQVQLTFQMKIHWVPWERNSSYSFQPIVLKLFRCFLHGMKIYMWFRYNHFFSLFLLCELFLVWNAIKVYREWVPYGRNSSYRFPPIVSKHCRCFQHGMKLRMWFWYSTLINFSHFFCFVNLVSSFTWNAIKLYRQWVPCGRNSSYSFPPIVLKHCRYFFAWNADMHGAWIQYFEYFSHFFCFVNLSLFFLREMLSKCIDSGYLVGATPLTVFHQLFWNFADVFCMKWRCACDFGIILGYFFFSIFPIFSY